MIKKIMRMRCRKQDRDLDSDKETKETGELHKEFSQYCGRIYTYKAVDIAKKKTHMNKDERR